MKEDSLRPGYTFVEASSQDYTPGSAIGRRVKLRLEDHSITNPFAGKLASYVLDKDYPGKGWYMVELDSPVPVYSDPVNLVLIQSRGARGDDFFEDIPRVDPTGKKVIYYYKNPLEEMLLNPRTSVRSVIVNVAVILDRSILSDRRLSHAQIWIHPFGEASRSIS